MANKAQQQQDTPEAAPAFTESGVELRPRPVYTGIVQGTLLHGETLADNREYQHGETFTTHDKALFDQLRGLHALKLPEEDAKTAEALIDAKNAEIERLKQQVADMTAAAAHHANRS